MIRILHLSDFHYKEKNDADFKDISKSIANIIRDKKIDLIVFSGDLAFDTNSYEIIEKASKCFIGPIKEVTGLDNSHFLIAPGNHDMNRNAELDMVKDAFSKYKTYQQIDDYCQNPAQLNLSLANFENYNKFIKVFYNGSMHVEPLYTYGVISICEKKIGLIAFNSAWRCTYSDDDRGHLVYPVYMVREAFEKIGQCDLIICAQHHNLSDYTDYVCQQIEGIINEKCHILFTGHNHKNSIQTNHDSEIGLLHLIAPATYNRNDGISKYGFSILEIDEETFEGSLINYTKVNSSFVETGKKPVSVPVSEAKKELNDFRKLIRKRYQEAMDKADALFVSGKSGVFKKLFKEPIIKNKSVQEIITTKREGDSFSISDILKKSKSAIIFGQNKKGKSSLLKRLELNVLERCTLELTIPFFLDYKQYKKCRVLNLKKEMHNYLEMNYGKVEEIFSKYSLLLLIDDLNLNDNDFIDSMNRELSKFPKAFFIATATESLSKQCTLINFEGTDVDKYYIHDITNKEVHQLTLSWPNIALDRKRDIEEKIIQISKNMHISLNYWTVSLFLWIFEKTDNTNIHNNFELVKLYIDELLGKEEFVKSHEFDVEYDDLKSYLAALAEKILYSENYALSEKEFNEFTDNYREKNLKFTIETWRLMHYLLDNGIIHRIDDKYTIRLKGVFEFLLALRMCENDELKKNVLENKSAFLSFGNELEYYAGFKKNDFDTIQKVYQSAKSILEPLTSKPEYEIIDDRLANKVTITNQDVHCTGNLIERLNSTSDGEDNYDLTDWQNNIIDETKLTLKSYHEEVPVNSTNVERILFILSRIYRNSNVCNQEALSKEILDYILTGTCNLGFLLVDEAKKLELKEEDNAKQWVEIVSNFIPIIIETFIYDAISQRNLSEVFKIKLKKLVKQPQNNQLKIFLITFILVDLDIVSNHNLINEALSIINNKILRFAILNKIILLSIKYSSNIDVKNILEKQRKNLFAEFGNSSIKAEYEAVIENRINQEKNKNSLHKGLLNSDYQ
ncbi:MAG: metallophosphoesterase [Bacteroidales bacterium]|nr:metallophosphoesterase [Bacteroidales bacterium]